MGRAPTIALLPPDIKERLQDLLRDPRISQSEVAARINALLEEAGEDVRVSKSGVNRYKLRMEEAGQRLRESREVAEMWIGKLGAAPQGQVGHLVNEILRTLAFDVSLIMQRGEIDETTAPMVAGMLKDMALAMQRLERAASENVRREDEIRRQERERAADLATGAARKAGLSEDAITEIRTVLGISA